MTNDSYVEQFLYHLYIYELDFGLKSPCYKDDLSIGCRNNGLDIIKVLRGAKSFLNVKDYIKNPYFSNPIGIVYDRERDTVEEMTLEDICKALGKNIKIVKE